MEKKEIQEWRDRLIKMFGVYHSDGQEYVTCPLCGINLDELADHMIKELDRAREEGLLELLEKKTNYKIGRVDHGYKVTQEYVLVSDIEKELSKLNKKK